VYPAEVERVVMELAEVGACAVVGLPDERLGQRVAMVVQPAPGHDVAPDRILEHCRAQLARYKVPEQVVVVDAFTRNAMGKIDRTTLLPLFGPPESQ
jgi:acyl-CoA synthetase (AMP-forming)/AMP-acid ligase II